MRVCFSQSFHVWPMHVWFSKTHFLAAVLTASIEWTCTNACTLDINIHASMHVCMHTHTHTHTHTHMCIHTYREKTQTHIYTHAHTLSYPTHRKYKHTQKRENTYILRKQTHKHRKHTCTHHAPTHTTHTHILHTHTSRKNNHKPHTATNSPFRDINFAQTPGAGDSSLQLQTLIFSHHLFRSLLQVLQFLLAATHGLLLLLNQVIVGQEQWCQVALVDLATAQWEYKHVFSLFLSVTTIIDLKYTMLVLGVGVKGRGMGVARNKNVCLFVHVYAHACYVHKCLCMFVYKCMRTNECM